MDDTTPTPPAPAAVESYARRHGITTEQAQAKLADVSEPPAGQRPQKRKAPPETVTYTDRETGETRQVPAGPDMDGRPTLAARVAEMFRTSDRVDAMRPGRVRDMRMGVLEERVRNFEDSHTPEEKAAVVDGALEML